MTTKRPTRKPVAKAVKMSRAELWKNATNKRLSKRDMFLVVLNDALGLRWRGRRALKSVRELYRMLDRAGALEDIPYGRDGFETREWYAAEGKTHPRDIKPTKACKQAVAQTASLSG
jgi:hypothetical protein